MTQHSHDQTPDNAPGQPERNEWPFDAEAETPGRRPRPPRPALDPDPDPAALDPDPDPAGRGAEPPPSADDPDAEAPDTGYGDRPAEYSPDDFE